MLIQMQQGLRILSMLPITAGPTGAGLMLSIQQDLFHVSIMDGGG